jgi:pSer/pThr/pTyr-binding forkhead associated (FHA) protein
MWMLRTDAQASRPFVFRIVPGNIKTLGRARRADFIVDAALVSRIHCRLAAGAGEIEAVDLQSTNGTYVNGQRVERGTLKHGDRLRIGAVELLVMNVPGDDADPVLES